MSLYLEVVLWWLIVPALAITAACGIWRVIAWCRDQYELARLWDDIEQVRKIGAGGSIRTSGRVGGAGRSAGAANSRPYDWQDDVA